MTAPGFSGHVGSRSSAAVVGLPLARDVPTSGFPMPMVGSGRPGRNYTSCR